MEDRDIIEMIDEETGEARNYVYMMTLTRGEKEYAVLEPADADDAEEIEVLIYELSEPDDEDCCELLAVEDEDLLDELFDEYVNIIEEEEENADDEDEEA